MRDGDRGEVGREDGGAAICVDPEKGATSPFGDRSPPNGISIHAPAKGAIQSLKTAGVHGHISIHAPAKGATRLQSRRGIL